MAFDPMDFFATAQVKSPQEVIREQMRGMPAPAPAAPTKKTVKSSSISQTAKNDADARPAPEPVSGQEMLPRAVAAQKRPIAAQSEGYGDQREDYGNDLYTRRAKMEEELASTLGDPDYSKMTQYAKDRSERGERDLMLAMAAGLGGEETKPIGAMFLKQAAEARNPIKVATGLIDENGQYIEDAEAVQERKGKRIDARIKSIDTLISSNIAAQDKIRLARERNDLMMMMKNMSLASAGAGRGDRANAAQDKIGARIYDDYMKNTGDFQKVVNAHQNLLATAKRTDAASDISFIFQYMKMLDPTSVVREGEFAMAQNAAGVPDQIRNLYNRALKGNRLNPQQRADFLGTAENLASAANSNITRVRTDLARQGDQMGINTAAYLPGYAPAASAASAAPPPPPAGAVREKGAPAVREVKR